MVAHSEDATSLVGSPSAHFTMVLPLLSCQDHGASVVVENNVEGESDKSQQESFSKAT